MISKLESYRGCLLGLAVGDAMGYSVDTRTWPEIQEDYGPNGLLGYDLVNGYAAVSSHTQIALFAANGLLLGLTRGQVLGKMAPYVRYVGLALQEWAVSQRRHTQPEKTWCWTFRIPELRRRLCTDTRMVETLNRNQLGNLQDTYNKHDTPASISAAVVAGLFANKDRMENTEIGMLGAESIALTHGSPYAFLPGAIVAELITRCVYHPTQPLVELVEATLKSFENRFGHDFPQAAEISALVKKALALTRKVEILPQQAMEMLKCDTGAEVLAGAIYAAQICHSDFDNAMVVAVNHSGRSAAVACLVGAILGTRMGDGALPDFYMDGLEIREILEEMAEDLLQGCPMTRENKIHDEDWDQKYLRGVRE